MFLPENNSYVHSNDLSNAMCNLVDVIESIKSLNPELLEESKDNDGSDFTVGDCLEELMEFLISLERQRS